MSHLLTVFRVSEDNHRAVDVAILQALLKGRDLIFTQMFGTGMDCLNVNQTDLNMEAERFSTEPALSRRYKVTVRLSFGIRCSRMKMTAQLFLQIF